MIDVQMDTDLSKTNIQRHNQISNIESSVFFIEQIQETCARKPLFFHSPKIAPSTHGLNAATHISSLNFN